MESNLKKSRSVKPTTSDLEARLQAHGYALMIRGEYPMWISPRGEVLSLGEAVKQCEIAERCETAA